MDEVSRIEQSLDAMAALLAAVDLDDEIDDHIAADRARWTLRERFATVPGATRLHCMLRGDHAVGGWLLEVGQTHVALAASAQSARVHALVTIEHCLVVEGLIDAVATSTEAHARTLGSALRELRLDALPVTALLVNGRSLSGSLVAVQRDHVDLETGSGRVVVPHAAVAAWLT